jgi:hypothetical protein
MAAMRRALPLLVIATLAAGPVAAHEYDGQTVVTWDYDGAKDRFFGRVGSMTTECTQRRVVKVQQQDGSEWTTVGKTRSKLSGRWRFELADAEGTFRAVAPPRMKVTIEHDHRCDRFASMGAEVPS